MFLTSLILIIFSISALLLSLFAIVVFSGIGLILFGFILNLFFFKPFKYWKQRGVVSKKPNRLFGHLSPFIFQQKSLVDLHNDIYNEYSDERYVGLYHFSTPVLLLRNPDLIKLMIKKNFQTFHERTTFVSREVDPIWGRGVFALPGKKSTSRRFFKMSHLDFFQKLQNCIIGGFISGSLEWKQTRSVIATLFTTRKLKEIFYAIQNCALNLDDYIKIETENGQVNLLTLDLFGAVTNDIIAKVSVGRDCNSFIEPNNEIFVLSKNLFNLQGLFNSVRFFIASFSITLSKWIKTRFIKESVVRSFGKIIQEDEADENKLNLVDVMAEHSDGWARMNALNTSERDDVETSPTNMCCSFSLDDVIAQVIVFFAGGFDTLRRAISYAIYELAVNPETQERLQKEINVIYNSSNDSLSYDDIKKMQYLDMVVSEALRKWPPIAIADRKASTSYKIYHTENRAEYVEIDEGVVCLIPIFSIHRDPNYYPNPDTFNPERFRPENKSTITPKIYFPFGIGRRACAGEGLSLMIIKTVLFYVLLKYKIEPVEETPVPIVLSKSCVNPEPDKPLILGFKRRVL